MLQASLSARILRTAGFVVVTTIAMLFFLGREHVSRRERSKLAMINLKREILIFAAARNRLPRSLDELPTNVSWPNRHSSKDDAWDGHILYKVSPDDLVTLTSYGKDRRPGGAGDAADIVGRFHAFGPKGGWADQDVPFVAELK
jgi:type II secretion system (T2SS) protein G